MNKTAYIVTHPGGTAKTGHAAVVWEVTPVGYGRRHRAVGHFYGRTPGDVYRVAERYTIREYGAVGTDPLLPTGGSMENVEDEVEPCEDCGHPVRWDEERDDWTHVDPERACWLHDSIH